MGCLGRAAAVAPGPRASRAACLAPLVMVAPPLALSQAPSGPGWGGGRRARVAQTEGRVQAVGVATTEAGAVAPAHPRVVVVVVAAGRRTLTRQFMGTATTVTFGSTRLLVAAPSRTPPSVGSSACCPPRFAHLLLRQELPPLHRRPLPLQPAPAPPPCLPHLALPLRHRRHPRPPPPPRRLNLPRQPTRRPARLPRPQLRA